MAPGGGALRGDEPGAAALRYRSGAGRWVLLATVLGSSMAFIDATVVNIALPALGRSFGAGASALQWTVNAYALTLTALILLGGSLGDRFGRRRVFCLGVGWFAAASMWICAGLLAAGAAISFAFVPGRGATERPGRRQPLHCGVAGPPLQPRQAGST